MRKSQSERDKEKKPQSPPPGEKVKDGKDSHDLLSHRARPMCSNTAQCKTIYN